MPADPPPLYALWSDVLQKFDPPFCVNPNVFGRKKDAEFFCSGKQKKQSWRVVVLRPEVNHDE